MGNTFLDFLDKEAPWIVCGIILPLILIPREMHGIALGVAGATFLGVPQFLLWFTQMKIFVTARRPELPKDSTASESTVIFIGDSIIAGYGASGPPATLFGYCVQAEYPVTIQAVPFKGTVAFLEPAFNIPRLPEGKRYRAVILTVGGNDAIPIVSGSTRAIKTAFSNLLNRATAIGKKTIVLANFEGLGEIYPVWWLRIVFRWRGQKVRAIFEQVLRTKQLSECKIEVEVIDIAPIITGSGRQAADGVHPNDRTYEDIWRAIKDFL